MCQEPTWCWEHVSQAYLMLRACVPSLLDRAWVVPSGCGGHTLICSESALSKVHYLFVIVLLLEARVFPLKNACMIRAWKKLIVSFFAHSDKVSHYPWSLARVGLCMIFQVVCWGYPFHSIRGVESFIYLFRMWAGIIFVLSPMNFEAGLCRKKRLGVFYLLDLNLSVHLGWSFLHDMNFCEPYFPSHVFTLTGSPK
jgi:hypothetical protein